jgi:branched-subunit amino acid ABC-type transport system permease component
MYGGGVLVYRLLMQRVQRGEVFTQIFATVGLFFFVQNGVVALFTSDYRFVSKSWLTA